MKTLKLHIAALIFFAALSCIAIYQPLFNAATHTGSDFPTDYAMMNWNFWWMRHALTTPGLSIYETNFLLFPAQNNLAYHTLTPFWFPAWALLEPFTGTLVAMNIIFVIEFTLAGYVCWLLLRRERVPTGLALAGAAVFQLTPATLLAVMVSHVNYVSIFWYPLQLLLWGQVARGVSRGERGVFWATIQGLAFYGMMMTDLQHIIFLSVLLIPYGLWTLIQMPGWTARIRLAGLGILALAVMVALLWFAGPLPYIFTFDTENLSPMPIADARGIPFPQGYLMRFETWQRRISLGMFVLPGLLLSLLASLTLLRRKIRDSGRWFWLAMLILPLLLSAGPTIMFGNTAIDMPYTLMHRLFGGLFRVPARFAPVIVLPALIFIGRTWRPIFPRHVWLGAALILIVSAELILYGQMPIQPVTRPYTFYETMGAESYNYVVVEVPVAGGSGEAWVGNFRAMETQFYGITHGKRMLNGSIARVPLDHFWHWLTDDPMLSWLGQRRFLEPDLIEPQLQQRIFDWPIGYIVIHRDLVGREAIANQEIIGYFNSLPDLLCPLWIEGDAVVFRTASHPDGCPGRAPPEIEPDVYQIDIGAAGDEHFIGMGWHRQEVIAGLPMRWAGQEPQTHLYVDLPPGTYQLELTAQAFQRDRELEIQVNGESVGATTVPVDGLAPLRFTIPADLIGDGQHIDITLIYDSADRPVDLGLGEDTRKLALLIDSVIFTRLSD
jgi:hypothetical protein